MKRINTLKWAQLGLEWYVTALLIQTGSAQRKRISPYARKFYGRAVLSPQKVDAVRVRSYLEDIKSLPPRPRFLAAFAFTQDAYDTAKELNITLIDLSQPGLPGPEDIEMLINPYYDIQYH